MPTLWNVAGCLSSADRWLVAACQEVVENATSSPGGADLNSGHILPISLLRRATHVAMVLDSSRRADPARRLPAISHLPDPSRVEEERRTVPDRHRKRRRYDRLGRREGTAFVQQPRVSASPRLHRDGTRRDFVF